MFANLPVQHAQGIKHAVVQVAAENKGQHGAAERLRRAILDAGERRNHPAFEPGKTFPLASLHVKILFQCAKGNGGRSGIAVGAQGKVHAEHKPVLGDLSHQTVDDAHALGKIFLV